MHGRYIKFLFEISGWFQKLLKSRLLSAQDEEEAKVTKPSMASVCNVSASAVSSPGTAQSKPLHPPSALSSQQRWSKKYDVLVCNSLVDSDIEEALRLVSFLEASPRGLRCFLQQRDDCPGGAASTELCQAVQNSHIWALLVTPHFLQDDWCKYIMHLALAEGFMSHRIIPLIQNLTCSQIPPELKFFFHIDLNNNPERGYSLLNQTVLQYLKELVKK
uniref:toll/interleukin-1 receptor domain-containing adapter protein n=1 Tax=Semicossyphus pulcher TaxID=241346 RepID=UPI0037E90872